MDMFKANMPAMILDMLEKQFGKDHIGLTELAMFVVMIEDFVRADTLNFLHQAYETYNISVLTPVSTEQADLLMQTFYLFFAFSPAQTIRNDSKKVLAVLRRRAPHYITTWNSTIMWMRDLMLGIENEEVAADPFRSHSG